MRQPCKNGAANGVACALRVGHAGACVPLRGGRVLVQERIGAPAEVTVLPAPSRPRMPSPYTTQELPVLFPEDTAGELPGQIEALDVLFEIPNQ